MYVLANGSRVSFFSFLGADSQSDTRENNSVIQFPWNGGDNQIWRTEIAA